MQVTGRSRGESRQMLDLVGGDSQMATQLLLESEPAVTGAQGEGWRGVNTAATQGTSMNVDPDSSPSSVTADADAEVAPIVQHPAVAVTVAAAAAVTVAAVDNAESAQ